MDDKPSKDDIFFNDNEPFVVAWLKNLYPAAMVDGRDIREIQAASLAKFSRCHFFAGIGGWEYALRLAGWPEDRPVWTGSCPCQPFSQAGCLKGLGDERHLWPAFRRLITECHPPVVFGEQVASRTAREWLSGIRLDLEGMGYAVGAADLCAASVGAPHIRQRLYWVADSAGKRDELRFQAVREAEPTGGGEVDGLDDAPGARVGFGQLSVSCGDGANNGISGPTSPWDDAVCLPCADGKARRAPRPESGILPLAYGIPARVGRLRAYGNSIVPQIAAVFVRSFVELKENR